MDRRQFDQLLALHCAPTLAGLKAASMVALPGRSMEELRDFFRVYEQCFACKGLKVMELRQQKAHVLLLIYRPVVLQRLLRRKTAKDILAMCGYLPEAALEELLSHLKRRMEQKLMEHGVRNGFPHEIGLFLGYPPHDVKGFIQHGGRNFRQCGFWKVYDNEKAVLHLFHCYAVCTKRVYDSLQEGVSLQSMICSAA